MRPSTTLFALAAAGSVAAQFPAAVQGLLGNLSQSCQTTILQLATTSDVATCIHVAQVVPILTSALSQNGSLIPYVDQLVGVECGQAGCSNATLSAAISTINSGCASDLQRYNVSNTTVRSIVSLYPLAREIVCLKTSVPYNGTDAPIPINSTAYNMTGGLTNCATSVLTEVSAKVHSNISLPFVTSLYQAYRNGSLGQFARGFNFSATDICNDCIFGAADLIGVAYPRSGNITLGQLGLFRASNMSSNTTMPSNTTMSNSTMISANTTLEQALDFTCAAQGFMWTNNGTLPATVKPGAVGTTFPYNITAGAVKFTGPAMTTPIRRRRTTIAEVKARWIGEQL